MLCEYCQKQHDGTYGSGRFCSNKCARGFSSLAKRIEINQKVSNTLKGHCPWNKGKTGKDVTQYISNDSLEKMREAGRKQGKLTQKKYGQKVQQGLCKDGSLGSLSYRKDELPIKDRLEQMTNQSFCKERINNKYIDFANQQYLIEYTTDHTKGVSEAIARLSAIIDDRQKIIITNVGRLGETRKSRCIDIKLIDVIDFWNKNVIGI